MTVLVTLDFPPEKGGIQRYLHEIVVHTFTADDTVITGKGVARYRQGDTRYPCRIERLGFPGERVEFDPEKLMFRINDVAVRKDFALAGEWLESPYELVVLGADEYLVIDNNVLPDEKMIWIVKRRDLLGKFLFKLPF